MATLIIDTEATSLATDQARIIEFGAMLTPNDFSHEIAGVNTLVWESGYPALTDEVVKVTHINQEMLNKEARTMEQMVQLLAMTIDPKDVEFVCAFNTDYDKPVFIENMKRFALTMHPLINHLVQVPWVCGMRDVVEHTQFKARRLSHLALEYGITVDPTKLHRAYGDVSLTRQLLHAVPTTAEKMWQYQQIPWVVLKAKVSFDDKDKAKLAGYSWQQVHGDDRVFVKNWIKRVKQTDIETEMNREFRVEQIA